MKALKTLSKPWITVLAVLCLGSFSSAVVAGGAQWKSSGQDITNNRNQAREKKIKTKNVGELTVKWEIVTAGPVSATPAVDRKNVYFPDFAGNLYALDRKTGAVVWQKTLADYAIGGFPAVASNNYARTTPAIAGNLLIFGDQGGRAAFEGAQAFSHGSARMMAVNKNTGDLVWSTQVDNHPAAIVTSSATVHGNVVYVGVASYEEAYAGFIPAAFYACCTFRGSVVALDKNTGAILWKTYMVPDTDEVPDYSGNAIWGSAPVVDKKRKAVYVATGNNYSVPPSVTTCIVDSLDGGGDGSGCLADDNLLDAVVALDMKTGEIKWSTVVIPFDTWNTGCLEIPGLPVDPAHCPEGAGPDFDFGQAPMLYSISTSKSGKSGKSHKGGKSGKSKKKRDLLAVGQKSGMMWSLDAETGEVVWDVQSGIGGIAGGYIWGSATDGKRIYGGEANSFAADWTLENGVVTTSGGWTAMDPSSGDILWQTPNPVPAAPAGGAVTVANGVLYGCAQSSFIEALLPVIIPGLPLDNMFAMDAATGAILWSHYSGGACNAGAAVVDGMVYWGYGYPGDTGAAKGSGLKAFGLAK